LALDFDIAIASHGAKLEAEAINRVRQNGDKASPEYSDKKAGNKMFFNLVGKMRRMKGLG